MNNYYISSLASGGGDGSIGSPWTWLEMFAKINDLTVLQDSTCWVKSDGVYLSSGEALSVGGAAQAYIFIKGYSSAIGDNGRFTVRRSGGTGDLIDVAKIYVGLYNCIADGQSAGANNIVAYRAGLVVNCISYNAGTNGFSGGYSSRTNFVKCLAYNNGGSGFLYGKGVNCTSYGNGQYGFGIMLVTDNCVARNNTLEGFVHWDESININCISDNNLGDGLGLIGTDGAVILNFNAINIPVGKYGIKNNFTECNYIDYINFYNILGDKALDLTQIQTYYELDPQFNDAPNHDYTRTGTNLDGIGLSHLGVDGIDYKIDLGIGRALTDYPSENDVRNGISYSFFTGNLTLPTEDKVLVDEQYGANGTEYTGTLSPVDQEISYPLTVTIEEDGEVDVTVEVDND